MGTVLAAINYFLTGIQQWQLPLATLSAIVIITLALMGALHGTRLFVTIILVVLLFSAANIVGGLPQG